MKPANGFHPWQGTIETGRLARRLVDLPPVEKLRLAARQDLRDRHERHTEAVQKDQVGRQLKGACMPRSRWTTMHIEKILPLTHGCSWFARKMRRQPRTRDGEPLHVGRAGSG